VFNVPFGDGHVDALNPSDRMDKLFYSRGPRRRGRPDGQPEG
jgi:hypothetical protein